MKDKSGRGEEGETGRGEPNPGHEDSSSPLLLHSSTPPLPLSPFVRPLDITRAGVVGMGTMGAGIAQAIVMAGVPAVVLDEQPAAVEKGLRKIAASLDKRVAQGKLGGDDRARMLASLRVARGIGELGDADLVIEAVFEDLDTKRRVLGQIESACRRAAIVATNTSTINLDELAEGMQRPERLVGMHFFNPAHHMLLVEIIRREATSAEPLAAALQFARRLGKQSVLVRNREGFVVNRVFIPYVKEAFWLLEEGADAAEIDAAMAEFGFPMGPLAVSDFTGLDIIASADRVLGRAFPHHGPAAAVFLRLVEAGHLGQKTGSGIYRYGPGDTTPHRSGVAEQVIAAVQQEQGRTPRRPGRQDLVRRLAFRMVAEAFRVVEEGVAASDSDVDTATVLGVGFPGSRGGVIRYARDLGLGTVLAELEDLAAQYGPRYKPCDFLRS